MTNVYEGLRSYQTADVLLALEPARNLWYEPQLGKTRPSCRILLRWIRELGYTKHLIIGPLFPLMDMWTRELRSLGFAPPSEGGGETGYLIPLLGDMPTLRIPHKFTRENRETGERTVHETDAPTKTHTAAAIIRDLIRGANDGKPVVVLLNDDMLKNEIAGPRGGTKSITDLLCEWMPEGLIRDEAHRDGNANSVRAQALRRLARYTKVRRLLTGTPDGNGRQKLYSQFVILDPTIFGTKKSAFMDEYFYTAGRQIVGMKNEDTFLSKVAAVSSVVRERDYFAELPPVEVIERRFALPTGAAAIYRELKEKSVLEIEALKIDVDATHTFAKLTRLAQLANGYLPVGDPDADGPIAWLHTAKIDSLVASLSEALLAGQKVVVSHLWRPEGEKVAAALGKAYGNRVVIELNGKTPPNERAALIAPFSVNAPEMESDVRIIVVQEVTGGLGISLARANLIHFLSWSLDFNAVDQMFNRTRNVQKMDRRTATFHAATGTVDIYKRAVIRRRGEATLMIKQFGFRAAVEGAAVLENIT